MPSKKIRKLRKKVYAKKWIDEWPPVNLHSIFNGPNVSLGDESIPVRVTVLELPMRKAKRAK